MANGRLGHGVSMVSENVRLAHLPVVLTLNEALPEAFQRPISRRRQPPKQG